MTQNSDTSLTVSVSVVTYRIEPERFINLLRSLKKAVAYATAQGHLESLNLIVVDNGDESLLIKKTLLSHFQGEGLSSRIFSGHGNVGYGRGNNLAIHEADSDFHLILNPDVEIDERALTVGIDYLQKNQDIGLLSPYALDPQGQQTFLCKREPNLLDFFLRGFAPGSLKSRFKARMALYEMQDLDHTRPENDVHVVSGCFMLARTYALKEVQGFNEKYFLYFEDFDLSRRLSRHYRLAYHPEMKIIHHGGNTAAKGLPHVFMFLQSAFRFFNDYGWRLR